MNINDLVNVQISLSKTGVTPESFQNILIVGSAPATPPATAPDPVAVYTSAAAVLTAGWANTEAVFKAANVAFKNGASKIVIAVRQVVSDATETIDKTLDRAKVFGGWYGFAVVDAVSGEYSTIVTWADANEKLFGFTADISGSITNPYGTTAVRAFGMASKTIATNADNAYMHVALMAVCVQYEEGAETWAYKDLEGIVAEEFTNTEITAITTAGLNYFTSCAGADITLNGKTVSGEWIDIIRFRDWLKNAIQVKVFELLAGTPKVPYTTQGIIAVRGCIEEILIAGQERGGIVENDYTTGVKGYTIKVPKISEVTAQDKQDRILRNCKFTANLAGAIHLVEIKGTLVM